VPHPRWGETPSAVVVAADPASPPTEDEIAWCRDRLASYKKPTSVTVVDALPRNATGQVVKPTLREQFRA
jgi:fatty-acyl-CoA synthase